MWHKPQPLWLPPLSLCPRSAELQLLQSLQFLSEKINELEKCRMPSYPSPPRWEESLLQIAWFSTNQLPQESLTLWTSFQHDLLVVEIQTGKVVAVFAGLPENLIEVGPVKALFSSVLSGKIKSLEKNGFWEEFPPPHLFIWGTSSRYGNGLWKAMIPVRPYIICCTLVQQE